MHVQAGTDRERIPGSQRRRRAMRFRVGMGAEAIKELLESIDLEKESEELKREPEGLPPARSVPESSSAWRL